MMHGAPNAGTEQNSTVDSVVRDATIEVFVYQGVIVCI
jgi:hypothetical protein